ncbi:MAG: type II secretion system F family protein [Candidatus Pacebacteria bacterium]|nr:type II secretion system F family protein [Candidatus Paceibacterota bacterium]
MKKFHYKAKGQDGKIEEGEATSEDRFSLATDMKNVGKTIISIKEIKDKKGLFSKSSSIVLFTRVKLREKILFMRNLSSMINAGLPLSRALGVLERQTKNPGFKKIIQEISDGITKGNSLSSSLEKHSKVFSGLETAMVRVGEESGNLSDSLDVVAGQLEKSYTLRKKIKSAMMYPSIIMSLMVVIGALMMVFVVPTLMATFQDLDVELPTSTKIIVGTSNFMRDHFLLFILSVAGGIFALISLGKTKKGKKVLDFVSLRIPLIGGIVVEYNTAQTTRTLSSLLSSGVGVVEAITITQEVVQNSYYKEVFDKSIIDVQKGIPLSESFIKNEKLYPSIAAEMVQVGEETGQLSAMLQKVALYYEEEVNTKTKDMSTIIEPFLMIIIGLGVGFFAVSMLSPMYSVMGNI